MSKSPSPSTSILPPVESTPIILIRFTEKTDEDLIALVESRLLEGGLMVVNREVNDVVVIGLTSTHDRLEHEAQSIRLLKRRVDTDVLEPVDVDIMDKFCDESRPDYDQYGLFNSNDWSLLVWRLLEDITVLPVGEKESKLSKKLDSLHVSYRWPLSFTFLKRLTNDSFAKEDYPTQGLRYVLERSGYIDVVTSIHQKHLRDRIWSSTRRLFSFSPPIQDIRRYYGEEIAFYFAWMGFLWTWLLFPAVIGTGAYCYRWYREKDISHDEYTPFYGLITFVWACLFLKFWKRQESRLSYHWGTLVGEHEKQAYFATRPEFHGRLRVSPVTGQLETFYPNSQRILKYFVSALISVFMLSVAFLAMICSLNLQGYITPKNDPRRWHDNNKHPFHFPRLSKLAEPGQLFDATSSWRSLIPVVLHVATIFTLNNLYRVIGTRLTHWENHQTELSFENSLILKRFLFEAFDCYVALFYLAFYERNMDKLRLELVSVFNIDTIRRIGLECILPAILQRVNRKAREDSVKKKTRDIAISLSEYQPLTEESELDPYEQFDDYMEIVIQFGYVTLFASAYPLASLVSVVANYLEIRSDCFKITKLSQRPRSLRTDGLGMWLTLMSSIVWLSALTNCLLFGFTSSQMMEFLPDFYLVDDTNHLRLQDKKGWVLIFIIFGLERVLIFLGMLLHAIIPDTPEDVMDSIERKLFLMEKETRLLAKKSKED